MVGLCLPAEMAENFNHQLRRNGAKGFGAADFAAQDQAQLAPASLLIRTHDVQQSRGCGVWQSRKRTETAHEPLDSGGALGRQQAHACGQPRCGDHSPTDGFPVQIVAIRRGRFKGMGESMAEIEDFAQAGFAFIAAYHFRLGLDAARDHEIESLGVAIRERLERIFEKRKQALVRDHPVFNYFVQSRAELPRRQRRERHRIREHQAGRVKRANQVLPFRQIDAGLAADGAIDLRDNRCGYVDKADAAQVGGGDESGRAL